jgi:predicted RNA-binding Zn-ribbon protein involved in translation (DUF1610 family)
LETGALLFFERRIIMAIAEVLKHGDPPVWNFNCPLCGHGWTAYYLEGTEMSVKEVDLLTAKRLGDHTYKAVMKCPCCGLDVWSDPIKKEANSNGSRDSEEG